MASRLKKENMGFQPERLTTQKVVILEGDLKNGRAGEVKAAFVDALKDADEIKVMFGSISAISFIMFAIALFRPSECSPES